MQKLIIKFWNGEIILWKSYWFVGELLNALLILLVFNFEIYFLKNNILTNSLVFIELSNFNFLTKTIIMIWTVFITVGIWRSAEKYKGHIIWIIATLLFLSYRVFSLRLIFF